MSPTIIRPIDLSSISLQAASPGPEGSAARPLNWLSSWRKRQQRTLQRTARARE
jgi:hypothetical protein